MVPPSARRPAPSTLRWLCEELLTIHSPGSEQAMQQPGVNSLSAPPATLKVEGIPSYVVPVDFTRLFTQLEGCVGARLLGG